MANVTGTDTITADLADVSGVGAVPWLAQVELIPVADNTGAVTLNVAGAGAWPIQRRNGSPVRPADLGAGRSYLLRRRNEAWRVIGLLNSDISDILDNGRVWHTPERNIASLTPPEGTDQISVASNTGHVVWRRLPTAPTPPDPARNVQDAAGTWWSLVIDTADLNARVAELGGGWIRVVGSISGVALPVGVNRLIVSSATELSFWRPVSTPASGTPERDDYKRDDNGTWWLRDHYFDPNEIKARPAAPAPLVGRRGFEVPEEMRKSTSGTGISAPLGAVAAPWEPGARWFDGVTVPYNATPISVQTSKSESWGAGAPDIIHPQIMEMPGGAFGARYVMVVTEYAGGLQRYENPILLTSADLTNWKLLEGISQPYEPQPANGYNSDPFIAHDPVSGMFLAGWRRYTSGDATPSSVLYVRATRDGARWTDPIQLISVPETAASLLSPSIIYDADNGLWHLYSINKVGGRTLDHRTARSITGPWSSGNQIALPSASSDPHHVEVRYIGNRLSAVLHDKNGAQLYLGAATDWTVWQWASAPLLTGSVGSMYKATMLPEVLSDATWRLRVFWTPGAGTEAVPRRLYGAASAALPITALVPTEAQARGAADAALSLAIREGAILRLTNIGGTGDAITADISPAVIEAGISNLGAASEVEYTPVQTNVAINPTLTIAGVTFSIRDGAGGTWAAGGFVVGRYYKLRRKANALWVIGGSPASIGLGNVDNSADALKPISAPQLAGLSASAVIHLAQVTRSDENTYSATIPAASRLAPAAGRLYRLVPSAANTGPVFLTVSATVDGVTITNALALTMGDYTPMPAGAFTPNEPVLIYQYNASYGRVVSVPYALHKALLTRVAALESVSASRAGLLASANIGALGDSITAGQGGTDPLADSYLKWAAHLLGCAYTNYGVGGAAMSPVNVAAGQTNQISGSFSRRAATVDWKQHTHASIAYGENDWRLATPLGALGDTDESTFYGALDVGLKAMLSSNPQLRIVLDYTRIPLRQRV